MWTESRDPRESINVDMSSPWPGWSSTRRNCSTPPAVSTRSWRRRRSSLLSLPACQTSQLGARSGRRKMTAIPADPRGSGQADSPWRRTQASDLTNLLRHHQVNAQKGLVLKAWKWALKLNIPSYKTPFKSRPSNFSIADVLNLLERKKKLVKKNGLYQFVLWREAIRGERDRVTETEVRSSNKFLAMARKRKRSPFQSVRNKIWSTSNYWLK